MCFYDFHNEPFDFAMLYSKRQKLKGCKQERGKKMTKQKRKNYYLSHYQTRSHAYILYKKHTSLLNIIFSVLLKWVEYFELLYIQFLN